VSTRSRARQIALQALYQLDQPSPPEFVWIRQFLDSRLDKPELVRFAQTLVEGTCRHRDELDRLLAAAAEHWSLGRMAVVDRNILRLGAYEMLHEPDTPPKVAIDEALELAKRFSTTESAAFVNGILDNLLQSVPTADDPAQG